MTKTQRRYPMDLSISQMMQLQKDLFEPHKDQWHPMEPEYGKDFILYMIEEVGEAIAILKKKGSAAVMEDPAVREAFLSEMADVLMYYHDILLRFHVTPEEISDAYTKKHGIDMVRNYEGEYKEKYHG
jgi:NTP pyrophosphatase (non-canonical NTP hydrolase)